jgi:hypothetical protein
MYFSPKPRILCPGAARYQKYLPDLEIDTFRKHQNYDLELEHEPEGYDGLIFGPDIRFKNRGFAVVYTDPDLKKYYIWLKVREALEPHGVHFTELTENCSPEDRNDIYNQCKIVIPFNIEAAACGLIPLSDKKEKLKNVFTVEADPQAYINHILYLRDNPEITKNMHRGLLKEVYFWQDRYMAECWAASVEKELLKRRAYIL